MTATAISTKPLSVTGIPVAVEQLLADAGASTANCLQCRKCSNGCPVADRADFPPHQLARMIQLGQVDELLASRAIWECTSCQTCVTRCPQKVDVAALHDALRRLSRKLGKVTGGTTVRFMADLGKFPMMLLKGKLAILPPMVRGLGARRRLFQLTRAAGGKVR